MSSPSVFWNKRGKMLWYLQPPSTYVLSLLHQRTDHLLFVTASITARIFTPKCLSRKKTSKKYLKVEENKAGMLFVVCTCVARQHTDRHSCSLCCEPPSPCCWDIYQVLLLCKDFRMFWSMSMLGKWEVCPFVKLALRDITNYIQGLFRRKLKLYIICTKLLDSIKNDQ